jgi:hypothetical protein
LLPITSVAACRTCAAAFATATATSAIANIGRSLW